MSLGCDRCHAQGGLGGSPKGSRGVPGGLGGCDNVTLSQLSRLSQKLHNWSKFEKSIIDLSKVGTN